MSFCCQNLYEKVHAKSDHITEQVEHGQHIIDTSIVQTSENILKIQEDIRNLRLKEEELLRRLDNSKTL